MDSKKVERVNFQGCSVLYFDDQPLLTEQHHKDSCDVNNILRNYNADTLALHNAQFEGNYGDFTDFMEYSDAFNFIKQTDEMFNSIPAHIRADFDNDPQKFVDFAVDPANKLKMSEYGFLTDNSLHIDGAKAPTTDAKASATDPTT